MKKIIIINKIVFFLIFKYCLFFNLESKSTLNSGSDSRPIIGSDFGTNITSQYRRAIIIQASIDDRSNIDSQHCELGPIVGPVIFSYMGINQILLTKKFCSLNQKFCHPYNNHILWLNQPNIFLSVERIILAVNIPFQQKKTACKPSGQIKIW